MTFPPEGGKGSRDGSRPVVDWPSYPGVVPLPRRVDHRLLETATSRLVRLAVANGSRDVGHLVRSTPGLRHRGWVDFRSRVSLAATLGGFDVDEVAAASPLVGRNRIGLFGEEFYRKASPSGAVCPRCIADDLASSGGAAALRPYRRLHWHVPILTTCPTHGVLLVRNCACGSRLDQDEPVLRCGCGNVRLREMVVGSDDLLHDEWVLGRLGVAPPRPNGTLDELPLEAASRLCRILGRAVRDVPWRLAFKEEGLALAATLSEGWRLAAAGEPGVLALLDRVVRRNRDQGRSCSTGYGTINLALTCDRSPALDDIRELLRGHARANVGAHAATRLLGSALRDASHVGINRLARDLGHSPGWLTGVIPLLPGVDSADVVRTGLVRAEQVRLIERALDGTMRQSTAADLLGTDLECLNAFRAAGLVRCLRSPARTGVGLLIKDDVLELAKRLDSFVVVVEPGELKDLRSAAQAGRVSATDLMIGVLDGRVLPSGRLTGMRGLPGLLFEPRCVRSLRLRLHDEVDMGTLGRVLGWNVGTLPMLKKSGHVVARSRKGVDLGSVERFLMDHVSGAEAGSWLLKPVRPQALLAELRRRGLVSVVNGPSVTPLFLRAAVAAELRPLMKAGDEIHAIDVRSRF